VTGPDTISRRVFLHDLGHGAVVVAVVAVAGCAPASSAASPASASAPAPNPTPVPSAAGGGKVAWERVNLGFVSAYILSRGGEAAIVDTGVSGSDGAIGESLKAVGLDWPAVGHVIVTHMHPDHSGSADTVMTRAAGATGYAATPDIGAFATPRPFTTVKDGDQVFSLRIVGTPGHTPGHISVLDEVGGLLVAGDAVVVKDGVLEGPDPGNSMDMPTALLSVKKMAMLTFDTLLVGHGDPILTGASAEMATVAAAS
jgi:glyoxylase-like metal-dependent hydrolase (beta-lactamase superfamily II)